VEKAVSIPNLGLYSGSDPREAQLKPEVVKKGHFGKIGVK
jgi:hypothetical protein